ncbi:efflux transporter outer membrane subunit [Croceicoccus naphthovorans]|uniref:efflux transporter outer membrane subunit n=1 Tax=Croceicoccus naphthovorans TaxID=1348774 RepID=UPI0035D52268
MIALRKAVLVLALSALSACTVGPDYERPAVSGEVGAWSLPDVETGTLAAEPWREMDDPVLTALIEQALAANLDIAIAEARLRQARAGLDAARGGRLPQVQAMGSATRQRLSENGQLPVGAIPGFAPEYSLYDAGFDASWELDLWGGNRRAVEAAQDRLAASQALRQEARLRVVAEVVRAYSELRQAQAEQAIRVRRVEASGTIAQLSRQSFEVGEIGRSEAANAEAAAKAEAARSPESDARARAAANALALMTAQPPEAMADLLASPADLPEPPAAVQAGLRADVLRRRPDVIAAEAQLAAATADVGVQTAELFPKISLLGSIGQQARTIGDLADSGSTRFTVGPSLSWPIFAGGRIRAQIRAAGARAEEAGAEYEKAVLGALADSETALNRYNAALAGWQDLVAARERAEVALQMARQRYEAGEDSRIQYNQARLAFAEADLAAVQAKAQAIEAHAALVKALGGGVAPDDETATGSDFSAN